MTIDYGMCEIYIFYILYLQRTHLKPCMYKTLAFENKYKIVKFESRCYDQECVNTYGHIRYEETQAINRIDRDRIVLITLSKYIANYYTRTQGNILYNQPQPQTHIHKIILYKINQY